MLPNPQLLQPFLLLFNDSLLLEGFVLALGLQLVRDAQKVLEGVQHFGLLRAEQGVLDWVTG